MWTHGRLSGPVLSRPKLEYIRLDEVALMNDACLLRYSAGHNLPATVSTKLQDVPREEIFLAMHVKTESSALSQGDLAQPGVRSKQTNPSSESQISICIFTVRVYRTRVCYE